MSTRGFKATCRPVLRVNSRILKHKYGEIILATINLYANNQLYLMAFGVVNYEKKNSRMYFMSKLREP